MNRSSLLNGFLILYARAGFEPDILCNMMNLPLADALSHVTPITLKSAHSRLLTTSHTSGYSKSAVCKYDWPFRSTHALLSRNAMMSPFDEESCPSWLLLIAKSAHQDAQHKQTLCLGWTIAVGMTSLQESVECKLVEHIRHNKRLVYLWPFYGLFKHTIFWWGNTPPYRTPEDTRLKVLHMHAPSVHTIVILIHTVVGERFPWLPDRVEGQCGEAARIHTCTETVDVFESWNT